MVPPNENRFCGEGDNSGSADGWVIDAMDRL